MSISIKLISTEIVSHFGTPIVTLTDHLLSNGSDLSSGAPCETPLYDPLIDDNEKRITDNKELSCNSANKGLEIIKTERDRRQRSRAESEIRK